MAQLNPELIFGWCQISIYPNPNPGFESTAVISAAPLTDHCIIKLHFISSNTCFKKDYWKFNSDLLKTEPFCQEIFDAINDVTTDANIETYRAKWEYLKYKVRQISVSRMRMEV